jgi:hypothetical protein
MIFGVATNEDRRQRSDNLKQECTKCLELYSYAKDKIIFSDRLLYLRFLYKSSPQDFRYCSLLLANSVYSLLTLVVFAEKFLGIIKLYRYSDCKSCVGNINIAAMVNVAGG